MLADGRGLDDGFKPEHILYRRCTSDEVEGTRMLAAAIRYDNTSVNWSKYSRPGDVIFDNCDWGIAILRVRQLPDGLPTNKPDPKTKIYAFRATHVPEDENYSHSEIWAYADGVREPKPKPSDAVKKEFRMLLSDRTYVVLDPAV